MQIIAVLLSVIATLICFTRGWFSKANNEIGLMSYSKHIAEEKNKNQVLAKDLSIEVKDKFHPEMSILKYHIIISNNGEKHLPYVKLKNQITYNTS